MRPETEKGAYIRAKYKKYAHTEDVLDIMVDADYYITYKVPQPYTNEGRVLGAVRTIAHIPLWLQVRCRMAWFKHTMLLRFGPKHKAQHITAVLKAADEKEAALA